MLAGEGVGRGTGEPTPVGRPAAESASEGVAAVVSLDAVRRADTRARRAAGTYRPVPAWVRHADSCQRSLRRPLPVAVHVLVGAGTFAALAGSAGAAASAGISLLCVGLATGVWRHRSSVQAQGVAWFVRRLLPAITVAAAAGCLYPGLAAREAALAGLTALGAMTAVHSGLWLLVSRFRRRGMGLQRTLVIGSEKQVATAEYRIHLYPEAGLVCAHSHVAHPGRRPRAVEIEALLGRLVSDHAIEHIVCTAGGDVTDGVSRDVLRFAPPSVEVTVVHPWPMPGSGGTRLGDLGVTCLSRPSWGTDACKRTIDIAGSALLLTVLSPLMVVTAVAIRLGDPGPAVFRQMRTGRRNRQFTIFKFRSMVDNAEALKPQVMHRNVADGRLFKAYNDPRITPVGTMIRRFSIDELPQLFNVLVGDMSLVGPRPLPTVFDDDDSTGRLRHQVLPGITGLWQVKGANALSYEDMIDLDCSYIATRSLGSDLRILFQTLPAVFVRRDPY